MRFVILAAFVFLPAAAWASEFSNPTYQGSLFLAISAEERAELSEGTDLDEQGKEERALITLRGYLACNTLGYRHLTAVSAIEIEEVVAWVREQHQIPVRSKYQRFGTFLPKHIDFLICRNNP